MTILKIDKSYVYNIIDNFKKSTLYFGGSVVQLLLSLYTSPIFARHLEAEEFAIIGYFRSLTAFLLPLTLLNLTHYYLMHYYRQGESENRKMLSNLISFLTISNMFVLPLSYILIWIFFKVSNVEFPFYPFTIIILITLLLDIYKAFILLEFRITKRALAYFLFSSSITVLGILTSLVYVVWFDWGAVGRMAGVLLPQFIIIASLIFWVRRNYKFKIDFQKVKYALRFSTPMIISAYFYIPIENIDKIYLERIGNYDELGYYSIGYNIANYMGMAATALGQAFEPDFIKYIAKKNKKKFFLNAVVFTGALVLMTIVFILFSEKIVEYLTSGRYTRAFKYANLTAIAILIIKIAGIGDAAILAFQKPKFMLINNIITGAFALVIYKICINRWEFLGANIGFISVASVYLLTVSVLILFRNSKLLVRF